VIVDAFIARDEVEMLELRCRTLADVVDAHVAVVSPLTHQGEPAPPMSPGVFAQPWADALYEYRIEDAPPKLRHSERGGVATADYQRIERWHRDFIRVACRDLFGHVADDTIMVSDVDEIPAPAAVKGLEGRVTNGWVVFRQQFYSTDLCHVHPAPYWPGTTASLGRMLEPQSMRDQRGDLARRISDEWEGWHFSWFGTDVERQIKLDTFSHAELRGAFDPAEGRRTFRHANGEELLDVPAEWVDLLPVPILDGSFVVPDSWRG
jgi:hypothetical protein